MEDFKLAPYDINKVITGRQIAEKLNSLIGTSFPLTKKLRTDGANMRKLIKSALDDGSTQVADKSDYDIISFKGKGIPRLLACLCDTYLITTGDSYNLQVWNRLPNSSNVLVRYARNGDVIRCKDIRFVLVKVDPLKEEINSIVVLTPQYIVDKFGQFGVPTVKHQMIIPSSKRESILRRSDKCLFIDDTENTHRYTNSNIEIRGRKISDPPKYGEILTLKEIKRRVVNSLIGIKIEGNDTKSKGQFLERKIAMLLNYEKDCSLVGGYPDIPNQMLEIKVQDSPTVDFGKYSPSNPVIIDNLLGLTAEDVRYIIALTNGEGIIEGLIISPGRYLGDEFTFVSGTSYKCQRSIPTSFFSKYKGKSVFNP